MGICGSLMGPKSENVEKPLVFVCFFEGPRSPEEIRQTNSFPRAVPKSPKWRFCMPRIVLPAKAGSTFSKNNEKTLSESEKWSQKTLDGKYDCYMRGLDGAEKRKC